MSRNHEARRDGRASCVGRNVGGGELFAQVSGGYVADPDDHAWEIAWNPAWKIDDRGMVTFGV